MNDRLSIFRRLAAMLLLIGCATPGVSVAEILQEPSNVSPDSSSSREKNALGPARCTVRKMENGWWFFSPAGKPFFSLGVCVFNQGIAKEKYDPAKPGYAAWRHYESPEAWGTTSLQRLKSWRFNTVGGWSDYKTVAQSRDRDIWMTSVLTLVRSGAPWFDMWDEKVLRRIEELVGESTAQLRDNPQVIGYYSDNELGWWNAILWKMTLEQPASSGQRQRLIQLVRENYADDWNALLRDFEPDNAENWEELDRGGKLWLRPGGNGIRTVRRFLGMVAERYYSVMRDAIRKFDPNAMYLGDRYQSFYYPEVALACGKHVDVVSTNLRANWNDGTFRRSYFDTLHNLTGKPIIVSEFYMAAMDNSSGNKNQASGFPTVANQRERRDALTNTLRSLVRIPYIVGADWFQYYDEPPFGRALDGEDYNFGLVDINDRPYAEVTSAFASLDLAALKSVPAPLAPDATAGVPPAPPNPLADFKFMTALKSWDRQRGLVPPATQNPPGDLYICWSPTALYLASFVDDVVEPDYYKSGKIPEADRAVWTVQLADSGPITARVGAGQDPVIDNRAVRAMSLSGMYHDVHCITAIEVPAKLLGKDRLAAGDRVSLQCKFTAFARANRIEWNGDFVLSK